MYIVVYLIVYEACFSYPYELLLQMYFHFGYDEVILFDWWRIDTVWELLLSMLGIFIMAFLYEGLKYLR